MKKALILAITLLSCVKLPVSCTAEYVTAPNGLNVRAEKSIDSEVINVLPFGFEVNIQRTWKKWAKVDGGFVSVEWISDTNPFDSMDYVGEWHITAYAYTGSLCANGEYPKVGRTVACNSLPFGTRVYIDGVGFRTVTDRGPDSMGSDWIDLYLGDYAECVQWGSQWRKVWTVSE